ncbi:MAG: preprotein translocase subunit SecA [Candidatus Edwardsbacteria bacterium]
MLGSIVRKIFGGKYEHDYRQMRPIVDEINDYFEDYKNLTDSELQNKTKEFKDRLNNDETLDSLLPEAYAAVKETCRRLLGKKWDVCGIEITWDMVPFDVQLMGAIVLHEGKIAEMATGEGKTLVATMPLYLNALTGKGAHLVTVNDYLAKRDTQWMGEIYKFLGLTVGCIQQEMAPEERKIQYNCDITYGTNNEFGFDYLRDNMAIRLEDCVQRGHYYAIVDEVDSVLIDEARTPLIISGPVEHSTHRYDEVKRPVQRLVETQTLLVNRFVAEAEKILDEGKEYEAGIKLLQAQRGAPKNKRLMKLLQGVGIKKLINRVELDYLRDKKMHELDADLYFAIDEKSNVVDLTERGRQFLSPKDPNLFVIPDLAEEIHKIDVDGSLSPKEKLEAKEKLENLFSERSEKIQNISQLLRAYSLFEKDVEYVVSDGKILIVDEFTGRLMPGRRYSDGLHQALEAKEGVMIERETQTLATITIQNYFRLYEKLAGMTGTAETEANEFWHIYKLDVVVIPTNEPVRRIDYQDVIYRTKREKYNAVLKEIEEMHQANRPVLVGTVSVDVSETLSRMLQRKGIKHSVLNAKYHQKEAEIVAFAGQPGTVTIATNMAGRGTDIKLGEGVVKSEKCCLLPSDNKGTCKNENHCFGEVPCGLHIIGTERHEARRIDRQLRGRSGRQGDPGSSRFYLSLEDDLMRLFGSDRIAGIMDRMGAEEGEVLTHPLLTRQIGAAQKRVEEHNFDIRKHLLEYDDVMNKQREVIYALRRQVLEGKNLKERIFGMIEETIDVKLSVYTNPKEYPENWNWHDLQEDLRRLFLLDFSISPEEMHSLKVDDLRERLLELTEKQYEFKEEIIASEMMRRLEQFVMLQVIDTKWRDHLYSLDMLKEGIGLRAYGQKDPLIEYKQESYAMFMELTETINSEIVEKIFRTEIRTAEEPQVKVPARILTFKPEFAGYERKEEEERAATPVVAAAKIRAQRQARQDLSEEKPRISPVVRDSPKIGRNDPCPCGSGKKYKKCCGK